MSEILTKAYQTYLTPSHGAPGGPCGHCYSSEGYFPLLHGSLNSVILQRVIYCALQRGAACFTEGVPGSHCPRTAVQVTPPQTSSS